MKKFFCILLGAALLLPPFLRFHASAEERQRVVSPTERVEHLFTHCLIAQPSVAFRAGNDYGKHLDRDCLTPKEFKSILGELYQNDYALVDITETFEEADGVCQRKAFAFPDNKKPLVLSFDDVVYASKNKGKGMNDKLIVAENGQVVAYSETEKENKNEFVPILEDFIKEHEDFSVRGARGIIFLTGFDGVFGYRTQKNAPNRESEREKAKTIARALEKAGWRFGSHSYAHAHMKKQTGEEVALDAKKWQDEVAPIVGNTPLYAYPYGEWAIGENVSDERARALTEAGFRVFFGVGEHPFYTKMPAYSQRQILFQDRCAMDGVSLRTGKCERFFNAALVYDPVRPVPFSP